MIKHISLVLFYVIPFICFPQSSNDKYKTQVKHLHKQAVSIARTNQDSAYYYLNKSIKQSNRKQEWSDTMDALFETYNIAFYHKNKSAKSKTLKKIDSLLDTQKSYFNNLTNGIKYSNQTNYYHGFYFYRLNNYKDSKKHFQKIINETEKASDSILKSNKTFLSIAYSYVAKMHTDEGKYEQARNLYERNLRFLKKIDTNNKSLIYSNYNLLAEVLKKENKNKKSNTYFLKSLQYHIDKGVVNSIMSTCFNISQNYVKLGKIDSARFYLGTAKKYLDDQHSYNTNYHKVNAEIYSFENNYTEALTELNNTLQFYKNIIDRVKPEDSSNIYNEIGLLHQKFNKTNLALENYNTAIRLIEKNNNSSTINQSLLLKILKNKTRALNQKKAFKTSITTTDKAISKLDLLKPTFSNNNDKLFLIENAFPMFENGLEALFDLYNKTKNDSLVYKAFTFTEKSKSAILLESLLNVKASDYANIPSTILEEESALKLQIADLEKKINKSKTDELEDELFNIRKQYRDLVKGIETNYKAYYNLKYNSEVAGINSIQNQLNPKTAMLSFFYGNNAIYGIILDENNTHFDKIEITETLEQLLKLFQKQVSQPKTEILALQKNAANLYSILVAPFLNKVNQPNLIILTDGLLNYIPFEALVKDTNYLVKDYAISYANSATLLKELEAKQDHKNNLLAFAPEFNGDILSSDLRASLQPLPHSKNEIQNINQFYKGNLYTKKEASLDNFKTNATNFGIIHLATHAIFDDTNPEYSYLAFGNEDTDLLYVADLYNLNLNANMVTLSACESGIGELKRGEGLLSLARGFYFSGAQSISSTLWKINDASSAKLMASFYKNLSRGQLKNRALQQAKLNFLNDNKDNALSHPYYWSGFIVSGNTEALTTSNYWLWIGLGLAFLVLALLSFRRKTLIANR